MNHLLWRTCRRSPAPAPCPPRSLSAVRLQLAAATETERATWMPRAKEQEMGTETRLEMGPEELWQWNWRRWPAQPRKPFVLAPRRPLAGAIVAADPAQMLSLLRTAVPLSEQEDLRAPAASIVDYCWRGRSGSTSAGLAVSARSVWRDNRQRRAWCGLLERIARRSRQERTSPTAELLCVLACVPLLLCTKKLRLGFETKASDADWRWRLGLQYVANSASAMRRRQW